VTFRLLTYNICRGGKGREASLADVIASCSPDLVVLQEAMVPAVVERLAALTGMAEWGSRTGESLGFLSRAPVADHGWHRPRLSRHSFLEIDLAGGGATIFGVHLSAVHAAWTERRRVIELQSLLRSIRAEKRGFHLLTGDFNTLAPGELLNVRKLPHRLRALVWLSGGRVRWRTIQLVLDAGYTDIYRRLHPDTAGQTFPTWDPHVRLDYVFAEQGHADRVRSCEIVTHTAARAASDHFPLLAEVELQESRTADLTENLYDPACQLRIDSSG
jgi:endonuclease/exonuclease/phosphatase family metal-dependent hydrolase